MSSIITLTRRQYEENLDPAIANRILGKDGKQKWGRLSPEMIAGDYDCYMDIDLAMMNESLEKQVDQMVYQAFAQDQFVNQNPAYAWELRALYLRSLGKKDVEKIIGPKPDYQLSPGDIQDENMSMYQEEEIEVNENDDHLAHINSHAEFKRRMSPHLTPNANLIITSHLLEHRYKYQQRLAELAMNGQQGGQGGAATQGNAGVAGAVSTPGMGTFQGPRVGGEQLGSQPQVPQGAAPSGPALGGPGGGNQ